MFRTSGIELRRTGRACRAAIEILVYGKLNSALSAQNSFFVELRGRPNLCGMAQMAFEACKPLAAAFELDRYYIEFAVPVDAARLRINADAFYFFSTYDAHLPVFNVKIFKLKA